MGGGAATAIKADLELVKDILGPSRPGPAQTMCFGPVAGGNAGSIFKPVPGFETYVESTIQILTVSEADGINKARNGAAPAHASHNDLLGGAIKHGLWGSEASNTASNVFPGFVIAKRTKPEGRVVSRTAFVKIPRGCVTLPKESVAALMELVETRMQADKLVIVVEKLEDDEALRKAWVRAFLMIGFEVVGPNSFSFNDKYLLMGCEF